MAEGECGNAAEAAKTARAGPDPDRGGDGGGSGDIYSQLHKFEESLDNELQGLNDMLGADVASLPGNDTFESVDVDVLDGGHDHPNERDVAGTAGGTKDNKGKRSSKQRGNRRGKKGAQTSSLQKAMAQQSPRKEQANEKEEAIASNDGDAGGGQPQRKERSDDAAPREGRGGGAAGKSRRGNGRRRQKRRGQRGDEKQPTGDQSSTTNPHLDRNGADADNASALGDQGGQRGESGGAHSRQTPSSLQQKMTEVRSNNSEERGEQQSEERVLRGKARRKEWWRNRQHQQRQRRQQRRREPSGEGGWVSNPTANVDNANEGTDNSASKKSDAHPSLHRDQKGGSGHRRAPHARGRKKANQQNSASSLQQKLREYHLSLHAGQEGQKIESIT